MDKRSLQIIGDDFLVLVLSEDPYHIVQINKNTLTSRYTVVDEFEIYIDKQFHGQFNSASKRIDYRLMLQQQDLTYHIESTERFTRYITLMIIPLLLSSSIRRVISSIIDKIRNKFFISEEYEDV